MPLHELIAEIAGKALKDLKADEFDITDPKNEREAKRKLEYWLMRLVIRGGSLGHE